MAERFGATRQSPWRTVHRVPTGGPGIAVHATGDPTPGRPLAVLVHGTGYLAQVWHTVASALADTHTVLAVDRRGHGLSDPASHWDFADFADDLCAVLDHFRVGGALGIAHSAGATDLLLAAARRPDAFARLVAVEPTAMLPRDVVIEQAPLGDLPRLVLDRVGRRRDRFPDRQTAFDRFRGAPAYTGWREDILRVFVEHALVEREGVLALRCAPTSESAMLEPIFRTMEGSYTRSRVFASLTEVRPPVLLGSCRRSEPVYAPMTEAARRLLPRSTPITFDTGHCVAQQDPDSFLAAVRAFAAG